MSDQGALNSTLTLRPLPPGPASSTNWAEWARDVDDPDWQLPRSHKFYVVETMCRALHTLATGRLGSKAEAVNWAQTQLPDPWRALVGRAQAWQYDKTTDSALNPEVRAFVLWCAGATDLRGASG